MSESVIYELHVKGFTRLHPAVPEHLRGTYAGLAYPAVIQHLVDLGVTAVELLPVHQYVSEPFLIGRGLSNYWGYNTPRLLRPALGLLVGRHARRAGPRVQGDGVGAARGRHRGDPRRRLQPHRRGRPRGPDAGFPWLDHLGYYRLTDDQRNDYDVTGCGNSVDTSEPGVLRMVLDSLRYWVTEMGVDGFRFDLVTTLLRDEPAPRRPGPPVQVAIREDPVLRTVKMIAEPWDMGPYGYQVGAFGPGWSEWNDRFRNHVRDFWRGNTHGVAELAQRLTGSPDIFDRRRPAGDASSINFVTAHDGFTMRDLVTYNVKHNGANGESNRDGSDDNRSWNCGSRARPRTPQVNALRHRQAHNLMATLLLSHGVPMITAGDELGRTQQGNNNAYCQDSPISWVHWDTSETWRDQIELTQKLLKLRAEYSVFSREVYRHGEPLLDAKGRPTGRKNIAWFGGRNAEMTTDDWHDGTRRTLGIYLADDHPDRARRLSLSDLVPRRRRRGPGRAAQRSVGSHLLGGRPHRG